MPGKGTAIPSLATLKISEDQLFTDLPHDAGDQGRRVRLPAPPGADHHRRDRQTLLDASSEQPLALGAARRVFGQHDRCWQRGCGRCRPGKIDRRDRFVLEIDQAIEQRRPAWRVRQGFRQAPLGVGRDRQNHCAPDRPAAP